MPNLAEPHRPLPVPTTPDLASPRTTVEPYRRVFRKGPRLTPPDRTPPCPTTPSRGLPDRTQPHHVARTLSRVFREKVAPPAGGATATPNHTRANRAKPRHAEPRQAATCHAGPCQTVPRLPTPRRSLPHLGKSCHRPSRQGLYRPVEMGTGAIPSVPTAKGSSGESSPPNQSLGQSQHATCGPSVSIKQTSSPPHSGQGGSLASKFLRAPTE